ncbi:MAG: Rid family hydrolase [Victivallales bacterium]|nr:Rid family hydrolase [Victivallales bacterium]
MIFHRVFGTGSGCCEHFFSACSRPGNDFEDEARTLLEKYDLRAAESGCSIRTEFLLRIHLSDVTNQAPVLRRLLAGRNSFISLIGQAPAEGGRLALEAWHLMPMEKQRLSAHAFRFCFLDCEAVLAGGENPEPKGGSFEQTGDAFSALEKLLGGFGGTVAGNTVRTWLYCRDVDNNYAGLVRARNEYFSRVGLTRDTHFIASTGVEGQSERSSALVSMDALSLTGLEPGRILYLSAPEMLSPTAVYGVSFERGVRILFPDRSHYYISGTASIDKDGKVVHPGDARNQTLRLLDNVETLLNNADGSFSDLMAATVYLRDAADCAVVKSELERRLPPRLPLVILHAPVCRPAWLVEMEAVAVNSHGKTS